MEQAREARDREPAGVWLEAAVARVEGPVVRVEAAPAKVEVLAVAAEAVVRVEEAALRQAREDIASVPSVESGQPINSATPATISNVQSAEQP